MNEIGSFDLSPIRTVLGKPFRPVQTYVPLVLHGSKRRGTRLPSAVALPFHQFYDADRLVKFATRKDMLSHFRLQDPCEVILSGVGEDKQVEAWWAMKAEERRQVLRDLSRLGIAHLTQPNLSVFNDCPRTDNLHAMKRLEICASELAESGLSFSVHVNGRTDRDFERWGHFLAASPDLHQVAFEFATGSHAPERLSSYADRLEMMTSIAGRPLDLFLRGGLQIADRLRDVFYRVYTIDSDPFMKSMFRQELSVIGEGKTQYVSAPTGPSEFLDSLLSNNVRKRAIVVDGGFVDHE